LKRDLCHHNHPPRHKLVQKPNPKCTNLPWHICHSISTTIYFNLRNATKLKWTKHGTTSHIHNMHPSQLRIWIHTPKFQNQIPKTPHCTLRNTSTIHNPNTTPTNTKVNTSTQWTNTTTYIENNIEHSPKLETPICPIYDTHP
jgi:hypothetical protein